MGCARFPSVAALLAVMLFSQVLAEEPCKFARDEASWVETKRDVIARGINTGLMGQMGRADGRYYLLGYYASQFKSKATFSPDLPLIFTFENGETLELPPVSERDGRWKYNPLLPDNQIARPIFDVTPEALEKLTENRIVAMRLQFLGRGEARQKNYQVKKRRAISLSHAAECVRDEEAIAGTGLTEE